MNDFLDEVALLYWSQNYQHLGNKSFTCRHNGYFYGDGLSEDGGIDLTYVYTAEDGYQTMCRGDTFRQAYFHFVSCACLHSREAFERYRTHHAQKYRLYSEAEVQEMTLSRLRSLRIHPGINTIRIGRDNFYAASNLKICEYIYNAAQTLPIEDLSKWSLRLYPHI